MGWITTAERRGTFWLDHDGGASWHTLVESRRRSVVAHFGWITTAERRGTFWLDHAGGASWHTLAGSRRRSVVAHFGWITTAERRGTFWLDHDGGASWHTLPREGCDGSPVDGMATTYSASSAAGGFVRFLTRAEAVLRAVFGYFVWRCAIRIQRHRDANFIAAGHRPSGVGQTFLG
jgi:hypothetical protein